MDETVNTLITTARNLIDAKGDGKNHTVAAAIQATDGKVYAGINVFHFTGGPCGEVSALAAALSDGNKELESIVAVGNNNRGVIAPCGRCRQILFEYCPNIKVVVNKDGGNILMPIKDLLPELYDWNAQNV